MNKRKAVGSALLGVGLLCSLWGLAIALATIWYLIANKDDWRTVDTTGIPGGAISFLVVCSLGLWLAGLACSVGIPLCMVGIAHGWRRRNSPVLVGMLGGAGFGLLIGCGLAVLGASSRMVAFPAIFWEIMVNALLGGEVCGLLAGALIGAAVGWAARAYGAEKG